MTIPPLQIHFHEGNVIPADLIATPDSCGLDLWYSTSSSRWIADTLNATPLTIHVMQGSRSSWLLLWRRRLLPGLVLMSGYPYASVLGDVALFWDAFPKLAEELRRKGIARVEIALSGQHVERCLIKEAKRCVSKKRRHMLHATRQVIDLSAFRALDELGRSYPAGLRWSIRKAVNEGVIVCIADAGHAEAAQALYAQTMREKGAPAYYSAKRFRLLAGDEASSGIGRLYLAYRGGIAIGMAAIADARSTRHLVQLAVPRQFHKTRAADLLVATALRDAYESRQRYFDFMATPGDDRGLAGYKAKWGGVSEDIVHLVIPLQPLRAEVIDYLRRFSRFPAAARKLRLFGRGAAV